MIKNFLTIDGGNTLTKYSLFDENQELVEKVEVDCASLIEKRGLTPDNTVCALVNVARPRAQLKTFKIYDVADSFKNNKFLDMPVNYSSTLGHDRLVLAYNFFDGKTSSALVDSGTFTTVDLVNGEGFQGGHILPGLESLMDAYDFGYLLKKMRPKTLPLKSIKLPQDSADAMGSGLRHSFFAPIEAILRELDFDELYITGGNGPSLYKYLKNSSFQRSASIHLDSDLIHKGLLKFLLRVALV